MSIEEQVEQLREQVTTLQNTVEQWRSAGIPERTLVLLLSHSTKISQRDVRTVLAGLNSLYIDYFEEHNEE